MAKSIPSLGFHVLPTLFMLLNPLRKHVERVLNEEEDDDADYPFPVVVDSDLYSDDPWHVLNDDDQWVVHNCNDPRLNFAKRSIFVFTELTPLGRKRFVRSAGSGTWDGATGRSKITWGEDDECIGTKKYFDFKSTESPREGRNGHWRMNEYRLAGKMLKGLENLSLATRIVLCEITQEVDKTFGTHLGWTKTALEEAFSNFVQLGLGCLRRPYNDDGEGKQLPDQENEENLPMDNAVDGYSNKGTRFHEREIEGNHDVQRGYLRRSSNDDGEGKQLPDQEVEENLSMYNDGDGYSNKGTRFHEREVENLMKKRIENRKELTEDWSTINSDKRRTVSTKLGPNLELALGKNHKENQLMTIEETDESTGDEMHTSYPSVGDQYQIAHEPEAGLHGFQTPEDDRTIPKTFDFFNKELLLAKGDQEHREFAQELWLPVPAHQPSQFIEFL